MTAVTAAVTTPRVTETSESTTTTAAVTKQVATETRVGATMTDGSKRLLIVGLISGSLTVTLLGGLSLQMALGKDPALGPQARAMEAAREVRPKRVVKRTVIVQETDGRAASGPSSGEISAATGSPAPPTPAPSPAPVVTRSS